nr:MULTISPECIES: DUF5132 domain-containing protein [unclassified Bradyrhizobium]
MDIRVSLPLAGCIGGRRNHSRNRPGGTSSADQTSTVRRNGSTDDLETFGNTTTSACTATIDDRTVTDLSHTYFNRPLLMIVIDYGPTFVKQRISAMHTSHNGHAEEQADHTVETPHEEQNGIGLNKTVATVAVVAVGAALFEAALLPGLALGVAAVAAPKYFPKLGNALNPLFKSTVRGTYKFAQKSKEVFAEAHEHVNDIVAEVQAEKDAPDAKAKPAA